MKTKSRLLHAIALCSTATFTYAGVDVGGTVPRMQIDPAGNLWFRITDSTSNTYCALGWYDLNMYIPASDANFPYYYGLILAAVTKGLPVYIGNISVFNGTVPCNVTQTGYGVVLRGS